MTAAPHLAELTLRYATAETVEEFFAATLHGFHEDYDAAVWAAGRGVCEPDRSFGYATDGRWVSTCGAYSRTLVVPGGTVPVAAVTFVTVQPSYRRRGLLRSMMTHQLSDVVRRGREPLALLWASEAAIYGRFGYGSAVPRLRLSGKTRATGFVPFARLGAGSVGEVPRDEALPVIAGLHARWLPERPGALDRSPAWWQVRWHDPEQWRRGAAALRFALHFAADGSPDGYAAFRVRSGGPDGGAELVVAELDSGDGPAYAALWRFLLDLDLVRRFRRDDAPVDEPLRHLVADERAVATTLTDSTYLRIVDLPRALQGRRYAGEADLTLQVQDGLLPQNDGIFRLSTGPDGARVRRTDEPPDVSLDVRELGSIYLGGVSLHALARAGLVTEHTAGAVNALATAFGWHRPPYCPDAF